MSCSDLSRIGLAVLALGCVGTVGCGDAGTMGKATTAEPVALSTTATTPAATSAEEVEGDTPADAISWVGFDPCELLTADDLAAYETFNNAPFRRSFNERVGVGPVADCVFTQLDEDGSIREITLNVINPSSNDWCSCDGAPVDIGPGWEAYVGENYFEACYGGTTIELVAFPHPGLPNGAVLALLKLVSQRLVES